MFLYVLAQRDAGAHPQPQAAALDALNEAWFGCRQTGFAQYDGHRSLNLNPVWEPKQDRRGERAAGAVKPPGAPLRAGAGTPLAETHRRRRGGSAKDIAERIGRDVIYVARIICMADLAPSIVHSIIAGDCPDRLSLDMLKNCLPIDWEEQRRMFIEPLT